MDRQPSNRNTIGIRGLYEKDQYGVWNMTLRVKNWGDFQHFKDRSPPWIKLYKKLLDDKNWFELDADAAKCLISLWLLAAENEGDLPDTKEIAFRLRLSEKAIKSYISKLSHWLIQDDINVISDNSLISDQHQNVIGTIPLARSVSVSVSNTEFEQFWNAYPKKVGKGAAETSWSRAKINGELTAVLTALDVQKRSEQWQKDSGQYIPNPATWLNQKRWLDGEPGKSGISDLLKGAI